MSELQLPSAPSNLSGYRFACEGAALKPAWTVWEWLRTPWNALPARSTYPATMRCAAHIWDEYLPFLIVIASEH